MRGCFAASASEAGAVHAGAGLPDEDRAARRSPGEAHAIAVSGGAAAMIARDARLFAKA